MDELSTDLLSIPKGAERVHDHGYVKLVDVMGEDEDVVSAARLSYGRGTKKVKNSQSLINYLLRHRHTSPFEMIEMKFQIRMPIFVMRQWVRHRTANLNEYSGRYSVMPELYYVPNPAHIMGQDTVNKQGSKGPLSPSKQVYSQSIIRDASKNAFKEYEELLALGVSREMARIILPLNMYTEIVWKLDSSNLMKFLMLRNDSHAQPEIQDYAAVVEDMLAGAFPMTYEAFIQTRESVTLSRAEIAALMSHDFSKLSSTETAKIKELQADIYEKGA